jgi:multimeric flavodoxin WrbA
MAEGKEQTAKTPENDPPRVLLLYYSFSGQTTGLLNNLGGGLRQEGVEVTFVRLRPVSPLRFPVGSISGTLKMMLATSLRLRVPIHEPEEAAWEDYDLILLGGPTWSYNPSGPILDLIDRYGPKLFREQTVIPIISCRGYWRMHWYGIKKLLQKCGAKIANRIIFSHPTPEPWRTLGVFLKIAGKAPERSKMLGKHYCRYGHSKQQLLEAENLGTNIANCLKNKQPLESLDLETSTDLS